MADPWVLSFPFPDRSPLIAFAGLSFAGNGLKHDMTLTQCLPSQYKASIWQTEAERASVESSTLIYNVGGSAPQISLKEKKKTQKEKQKKKIY